MGSHKPEISGLIKLPWAAHQSVLRWKETFTHPKSAEILKFDPGTSAIDCKVELAFNSETRHMVIVLRATNPRNGTLETYKSKPSKLEGENWKSALQDAVKTLDGAAFQFGALGMITAFHLERQPILANVGRKGEKDVA